MKIKQKESEIEAFKISGVGEVYGDGTRNFLLLKGEDDSSKTEEEYRCTSYIAKGVEPKVGDYLVRDPHGDYAIPKEQMESVYDITDKDGDTETTLTPGAYLVHTDKKTGEVTREQPKPKEKKEDEKHASIASDEKGENADLTNASGLPFKPDEDTRAAHPTIDPEPTKTVQPKLEHPQSSNSQTGGN